jgi:hypothetical protein
MVKRMRAVVLLMALFVAADASAQMRGKRGGRPEAKGAQREKVDLFQATAEELRVDLNLSDKQMPLWDAYLNRIEAFKHDLARQQARARAPQLSADAPRALDRLVDVQRDRMTAMEEIADAGRALYKTLSDEQKTIADARLAGLAAVVSQPTVSRNQ